MTKMIEHHIKYKEIHGEDLTVWMTMSEHKKLHHRLRKTGKCCIKSNVLKNIANAAYNRTGKSTQYKRNNNQQISFIETIKPNVRHHERIQYNNKTGSVIVSNYFTAEHGKELLNIILG